MPGAASPPDPLGDFREWLATGWPIIGVAAGQSTGSAPGSTTYTRVVIIGCPTKAGPVWTCTGEERVHGGNRYNPWEHASRAGVAIEWCADCLEPGVDHAYVAEYDTLILRNCLPTDRLNLAAAVGLAERDLLHDEAPDGITDPVAIAAYRLIPLADLCDAMARHRGGITAVAAALDVPPTLVRLRLDSLCERKQEAIRQAVIRAKTRNPRSVARYPLRATAHAARILSGSVSRLIRQTRSTNAAGSGPPHCPDRLSR